MANMKADTNSIRAGMLQAIIDRANGGGGGGAQLLLYSNAGAQPAGGASPGASVLLGTMTITGTFGTISAGVLTLGTITQDSAADASGVASWMRVMQSNGSTWVMDLQVTVTGGGGDVTMPSTSVTVGLPIQMTGSQTITAPCAP